MFNGIALWNSTGGTYTEEWRYGDVCVCSCHPLLHHDSSLNPQGDFLVTQERGWLLSLFYSFIMGTPQCLRCSLFCCIHQNYLNINWNCVLFSIWILKILFITVYLHVKKIVTMIKKLWVTRQHIGTVRFVPVANYQRPIFS